MMMVNVLVILVVMARMCDGVIYHLNESEYDRMPPLFGIDSNYPNCLMRPGGVYCVAQFELHGDPHNELIHIIREYSEYDIKHYNHSIIDRAICVTKSCKKFMHNKTLNEVADLNVVLEGCINETIWTEYGLEAKLTNVVHCDKHGDRMPVDLVDWIFAGILISLLAMNLIGSVYDVFCLKNHSEKKIRNGNPYLLSFSIFRNWEKLVNINEDARFDRLGGMHGLKTIIIFFIPLAHEMWFDGPGYTDNPRDLEISYEYFYYQLIFNGTVIVQIFFIISGCLLTYHLQVWSEDRDITWRDVPKMLFFRWSRLTPANALGILFFTSWFRHLGSGPLWNLFVMNVATDCRIHWWKHLIHLNNYVPEDRHCALHTWHLASEFQLFTIGLVVYVATAPRRRYVAIASLALVGLLGPAMHVWLHDLDALVIMKPEFYRTFDSDTFHSMHVFGHNNLSCYAIGMALGLVSYYCIKHKIEYTSSTIVKFIIWCIPLGIVGLILSGRFFYIEGDRPHVFIRMSYAAVQRPAMGVMTAMLILNLVLRFESFIRHILEWRGWVVTSRLSYSVYWLHFYFIYVLLGKRTQLGHVSFLHLIVSHFGIVSLSLAAAVPFYLMLEAPLMAILKMSAENLLTQKQKKMK